MQQNFITADILERDWRSEAERMRTGLPPEDTEVLCLCCNRGNADGGAALHHFWGRKTTACGVIDQIYTTVHATMDSVILSKPGYWA